MYVHAIIGFAVAFLVTVAVIPLVIKIAFRFNIVDKPNHKRKVHNRVIPYLGGLAIFLGVVAGFFASGLYQQKLLSISFGAILIVITGLIDDKYDLPARFKLIAQIMVAIIVVRSGLIMIDVLNIPFFGRVELGFWGYILTVIWIVAITNAVNLIDGLDGLAAGISSIGIATIAVMAALGGKMMIFTLCLVLLGSTLGFLIYNFYPAKIFMGDTGSMFLGYSIAVFSVLGIYKSVTLFSLIVPITLLGVPIFDTIVAIFRRIRNGTPISAPDRGHLHHRLLDLGLSQRKTVLIIYAFGFIFGVGAILLSHATIWGTIIGIFILLFLAEILAEALKLIHVEYRPIINFVKKVFSRDKGLERDN